MPADQSAFIHMDNRRTKGQLNVIDIPGYDSFIKIEQLDGGYSSDKKCYVETVDGKRLLLRISDISQRGRKKDEYEMMKRVASLDIPMPLPVDFGVCDNGGSIYQLLTWCDGESAENVLPRLNYTEQYALGIQAGQILRKIHTLPAPETQESWMPLFKRKAECRIQELNNSVLQFAYEKRIIGYIEQNQKLMEGREQCFRHNDYHNGNMLVTNDKLIIVDFNDYDFGDPWEEFIFTVWNAQYYHHFSVGQIQGYFNGEPPIDFWRLLANYTISFSPTYILWGTIFGNDEIERRMKLTQNIIDACVGNPIPVPCWYNSVVYNGIY